MVDWVTLYQDKPDILHFRPNSRWAEMYDGPEQRMVYHSGYGLLKIFDHEHGQDVTIQVSRWKLVGIGLGCILAALKR
ncbi:hypothetical protein [Bradyrhizobium sp. Tv2a-2]|uniref:hypothetical protein n=1 Tax=Bradyrhizobium sp. Tv2a-2 TaxID=113395 RepID=UPI00046718A9|nr:hypothetical protein [Bradyrhizobium sp. Tv2a-2]